MDLFYFHYFCNKFQQESLEFINYYGLILLRSIFLTLVCFNDIIMWLLFFSSAKEYILRRSPEIFVSTYSRHMTGFGGLGWDSSSIIRNWRDEDGIDLYLPFPGLSTIFGELPSETGMYQATIACLNWYFEPYWCLAISGSSIEF